MKRDRGSILQEFFRELESRQMPYAILHDYAGLPDSIPSDVDFAVRDADLTSTRSIAASVAERHGWVLAQSIWHQVTGVHLVLIDPANPEQYLQLDACSHFLRDGMFLLSDAELLKGAVKEEQFYRASYASEFAYVLAKSLSKGVVSSDKLSRLEELREDDPSRSKRLLEDLVGANGKELTEQNWPELRAQMRARKRCGLWLRIQELGRIVKRVLQPTGSFMAVLGPDGAGKSTLLPRLRALLKPCFQRDLMFHFRPALFGKKSGDAVSEPHSSPPRWLVMGWAKVVYYFWDHCFGWMLKTLPAIIRTTLVLFDRSFDDLLMDPKRYRLKGAAWLIYALRVILPKPDLTLILDATPEVVHARKPELSVAEIERQRKLLRSLAESGSRYVLLNADHEPEAVAHAAAKSVIEWMAERERRRFR